MIAASILLGRALAPIEQTISQWASIGRALHGWRAVRDVLAATRAAPKTSRLPVPKASVRFDDVTTIAPGGKVAVLHRISFEIEPGQVLGVIGNSGMGKSTLASAMVGVTTPLAGEIRLGGATLDQYDPDQLGRLIGYLLWPARFTGIRCCWCWTSRIRRSTMPEQRR